MTELLERAKEKLHDGGYAFVLINGDNAYESKLPGIAALKALLKESPELLIGASVADKVVGKAAALLMIYGGVGEIYADYISALALPVLVKANVSISFGKEVPYVENRDKTDMCPMEKRVLDVTDPKACYDMFCG